MPAERPSCANFGSGPCAKRPGWSLEGSVGDAALGRSHRSSIGKAKLLACCEETKAILGLPDDYLVGIVPASDTGAVEMVMWSMLGPRPVDICFWETFGKTWYDDAVNQLGLSDVREISAPFGSLPDLSQTDASHDIVFTFNGTTGGAKVPSLDWISDEREGLTICDATSAIFGMDMTPWRKLDVVTYSWQKAPPRHHLPPARRRSSLASRVRVWLPAGARRGGRAWRAHPGAAGGAAARVLPAEARAAKDLPHDQGRQAHQGHLSG